MGQDLRQDDEQATSRRAQILGFHYIDTSKIDNKQLYTNILSGEEVRDSRIVPLSADHSHILFGITTTTSQQVIKSLDARYPDQRISCAIISDAGFRDYLNLYLPPKKIVYEDVSFSAEGDQALQESISKTLDQVRADDMLAYLVKQAYRLKASDIHLENQKDRVRIRFRVDGVLHVIAHISNDKYRQLASAIAVAANVSTSDPNDQAGHINRVYRMVTGEDVTVNLRVETIPTVYGQDVVMRLFNLKFEMLNLDKLTLSAKERDVVNDVIKHPTGMVLVVGPTGSGKTTTMYALVNTLNSEEIKIITLEDPVEYFLDGIVQIPVSGQQEGTKFAERLRAVLRLDPDVVMVGEIRDQDTARTALQASLTGHLVLSTFHAFSAAAALSRMLDYIGINPLFASAIHLVMAQRLARLLDEKTRQPYQPDDSLKQQLQSVIDGLPPGVEKPNLDGITLYKPGSSSENPFGYSGQLPLREQLQMTPGVQKLLRLPPNQITTEMLEKQAVEDGMLTMLQDGVLKALQGLTTIEEVYRVVG